MRADLLLSNADLLVTCDDDTTVLARASVVVRHGRIVAVGEAASIDATVTADEVLDLRGQLLMPGLVNLHTHLPMTLLRGIAEDVDLQGFLAMVWAEEARVMDPDGVLVGARLGALEALLGGTTTALDMYFHPAAAHQGAVDVGLRHVIGPVFFSFPGPDDLSWPRRLAALEAWPEQVARIGGPHIPLALMPHAPLTVGPAHLAEVAAAASRLGALVTTHASENPAENRETLEAHHATPTELLEASGLLALRPVLAHAVHLSAGDRALIAARGASVAHCPGSNLKLASGAADIVAYRALGIRVGLGTDGCSSSNDLDMFSVMRQAANLARLVRNDPAAISARDVVRAATIEGARALGLGDRIGSVEVGKEADVVTLDLDAPHLVPLHEPHTALVHAAGRADVRHTIVAGEVVIRDRRPTRVDGAAIIADARALATR